MAEIRHVTDAFAVAPQLTPEDLGEAATAGFRLIINNRPDGEAPDQPTDAEMRTAAEAAGLGYVHIPVRGGPTAQQIAEMRTAIEAADGPTLAFCRSGTRSITTWALSEAALREPSSVLRDAAAAGYDLRAAIG